MRVCIVCEKDVEGKRAVPVKEDRVIRLVRAAKRLVGIAKMNDLYVCEADLPKHSERRKGFEKSMLFASVLAALLLVLVLGMIVLSGNFEVWSLVSAFVIAGFVLVLPLFKYTPAVEATALPPEPPALFQPVNPPPVPPQPLAPSNLRPAGKTARKKRKSR